ncbi:MAG TPA: hypothetical protein VHE36_13030 [Sphingomicrobium sp.]|nr:hypothetical protein [Sphingomicrobium sp.]
MSSAPTAEEIARDATWLAQALDPGEGLVRLVAMDEESYRLESFLDDRLLQRPVDAQILPWPTIEEAITSDLRSDCRWIFHIGHVGSTLVSRLLGEIEGVLAIREPRLLRDLALTPSEMRRRYLEPVARLMSRTFGPSQFACVKATSFASEIADALVPAGERALFMFTSPVNYVASILAGENSIKELHLLAGSRAQRLNSRGLYLPVQNEAGLAAAAWACEMTSLEQAAERMADRKIEWADFDAMLGDMEPALERIALFFGFESGRLPEIVAGPLMGRYSKAMEHQYSTGLRRDLIGEAHERFSAEIKDALAMLQGAAEKSPLLARALARAREG